jgi:aminoacylase
MQTKLAVLLCAILFASYSICSEDAFSVKIHKSEDIEAIERFRKYLQIKSVHPKIDYTEAITFLQQQCDRLSLECKVHELLPGFPTLVMKWAGKNQDLPSIMLNSHMDVVPVNRERWNNDPFEAYWDQTTQNIYARGSQDMKCVGMQYIEAIDRLQQQKFTPERNVYVTFVPEEEVGGHDGMEVFVNSKHFDEMNVGFGLDEGLATPTDSYQVYYGERVALWGVIEATGAVGHGSAFIENTATEKLARVIERIFAFRRSQQQELKLRPEKRTGDVVSINLTSMKAGHTKDCGESYQMNVIPREAQVGFDIRVTPHVPIQQVEKIVNSWLEDGVTLRWVQYASEHYMTDPKHERVVQFLETLKKTGVKTEVGIFPAATDARFVRSKNVPVIGFSPMINHPVLLHDHNEYLNANMYLTGIEIYQNVISEMSK